MNKLHTRWAEARLGAVAAMLALSLAACASTTEDIGDTGLGPRPELPSPQTSLLPTINIAPVQTRRSQSIPTAPPGFTVTAFASGLEHPRWVYPLPDGDLLVAESNAPAQHDEHGGIVGWVRKQVMKFVMKRAGAGVPSPDRIVLLRGAGRHRAKPQRADLGASFAVRHGARRRLAVCRGHRRAVALSVSRGRYADHNTPARRWPICRPGRSIITGPRMWWRAATGSVSM